MLLWFVVTAPILVAEVFRSPMVDYRLVALGAALPLADAVTGGRGLLHDVLGPLHTLAGAVLALAVVMVGTVGRRLLRRRLLGLPVGLLCHLVLDGTFTRTDLFWWPAFGWSIERPSESTRPVPVWLALEAVAVGLAVWAWRHYDLGDGANRRMLARHGHLARGVL